MLYDVLCAVLQEDVYEQTTKNFIRDVLRGYNVTVFAYGPTGTHTHTVIDIGRTHLAAGDINVLAILTQQCRRNVVIARNVTTLLPRANRHCRPIRREQSAIFRLITLGVAVSTGWYANISGELGNYVNMTVSSGLSWRQCY